MTDRAIDYRNPVAISLASSYKPLESQGKLCGHQGFVRACKGGRKRSHWIWYVFPQIAGLGSSSMSRRCAIKSVDEAKAYLAHPVLGKRLVEICDAALAVEGKSAHDILGSPDDMKLKSCATLFASVSPPGSVVERLLEKYFQGERDGKTLELIGSE